MEQQYITLIIAGTSGLVGSVVGAGAALFSGHLTNRSSETRHQQQLQHEKDQRKQELLRARGEELYALTSGWLKAVTSHHMTKTYVMLGTIAYNQGLDLELKNKTPVPDFEHIGFLIDVYFPSARNAYDAMLKLRDERSEIEMSFDRKYKTNGPSACYKQFLPAYGKALLTLEASVNALKKQIVESLQSIQSMFLPWLEGKRVISIRSVTLENTAPKNPSAIEQSRRSLPLCRSPLRPTKTGI